jgi:transcription elongation factor Elf1
MTVRSTIAFSGPSPRELARPNCPRCGGVLLVAEVSEFDTKGRIRHSWSCDDCGHEFQTSIRLRVR